MSLTEPPGDAREPEPLGSSEERPDSDLLAAAPALVRLGLAAYVRTLGWSVQVSINAANRALRLVLTGEGAEALVNGISGQVREQLKRLLGISEIEARLDRMPEPPDHSRNGSTNGQVVDYLAMLKQRGAELLERSASVEDDDHLHPAYERILTSLAPDEARILRLMAIEGPRASVDVRTWRPLSVGSELVEPGITMIGHQAGCRHLDRVSAYLDNLHRLGLIWFSREPMDDLSAYQVLEAQPEVAEAMKRAGRGKTLRRSVNLTPFGKDFCETCLPLDTAGFLAVQNQISHGGGVGGRRHSL